MLQDMLEILLLNTYYGGKGIIVLLILTLFQSYVIYEKYSFFSHSATILKEMVIKYEQSKNFENCYILSSVLIFSSYFWYFMISGS